MVGLHPTPVQYSSLGVDGISNTVRPPLLSLECRLRCTPWLAGDVPPSWAPASTSQPGDALDRRGTDTTSSPKNEFGLNFNFLASTNCRSAETAAVELYRLYALSHGAAGASRSARCPPKAQTYPAGLHARPEAASTKAPTPPSRCTPAPCRRLHEDGLRLDCVFEVSTRALLDLLCPNRRRTCRSSTPRPL